MGKPARKTRLPFWALVASLLALSVWAGAPPAPAGDMVRYDTAPVGSLVKIKGTTNVHDWTAQGEKIVGSISVPLKNQQHLLDGNFPAEGEQPPVDLSFLIPVRSLHSKIPGLEQFMWESLNYREHPNITYRLARVRYLKALGPDSYLCSAQGDLSVNGVSKPYDFQVTFTNRQRVVVEFMATGPLRLSDFGLKPPVLLKGMVKSGDTIHLQVRWVLHQTTAPPGGWRQR